MSIRNQIPNAAKVLNLRASGAIAISLVSETSARVIPVLLFIRKGDVRDIPHPFAMYL